MSLANEVFDLVEYNFGTGRQLNPNIPKLLKKHGWSFKKESGGYKHPKHTDFVISAKRHGMNISREKALVAYGIPDDVDKLHDYLSNFNTHKEKIPITKVLQ